MVEDKCIIYVYCCPKVWSLHDLFYVFEGLMLLKSLMLTKAALI